MAWRHPDAVRLRVILEPHGGRLGQWARAVNQALSISVGGPIGMPAIFGVSVKGCPGSTKPGVVQLMA